MATYNGNFSGLVEILATANLARGSLSAETALSIATSAYDRAETFAFTSTTSNTSTRRSGSNADGDSVDFTGLNLLTNYPSDAPYAEAVGSITYSRLEYQFAEGGPSVVLTGGWYKRWVDFPFMGEVRSGAVSWQGGTVTFTGVPLGRTDLAGFLGFDHEPVVGAGRMSAIRFEQDGAVLLYQGSFVADTETSSGLYVSTIEGTVTSITVTYLATTMSMTGLELQARDVLGATPLDILALGLAGNDTVDGTAGNDWLPGMGGNDTIKGGGGNDTLNGGFGDDTLSGDAGLDVLFGGAGSDTYLLTDTADEVWEFAGEGDADVARYAFTKSGRDTLDANVEQGVIVGRTGVLVGLAGNELANVLTGSSNADTLEGGAGDDSLVGNAGNDSLSGGLDNDMLLGGAGVDRLRGGAGNDLLQGGTGGDTYHFSFGDGHDLIQENDATAKVVDTLIVEAGSGNVSGGEVRFTRSIDDADDLVLTIHSGDDRSRVDTVTFDEFFASDALNARAAIEQFRFVDGNVTLTASQVIAEALKGTAGDDAIRGTSGNNGINGREGNDTIAGAAGNDTLIGHWGDDSLSGDAGADLLQGNLGADWLSGGEGNDILDGGAGADDLDGGTGNDVLLGGTGNDSLAGGDGLDTLTGGAGDDNLAGGAGADRFVLNSLTGTDTITDFESGIDKIAVNKSVFTGITTAASSTSRTVEALGPAFAYDLESGQLTYDADGAGGSDPAVVAQLQAGQALAADFLIIG